MTDNMTNDKAAISAARAAITATLEADWAEPGATPATLSGLNTALLAAWQADPACAAPALLRRYGAFAGGIPAKRAADGTWTFGARSKAPKSKGKGDSLAAAEATLAKAVAASQAAYAAHTAMQAVISGPDYAATPAAIRAIIDERAQAAQAAYDAAQAALDAANAAANAAQAASVPGLITWFRSLSPANMMALKADYEAANSATA